MKTAVPENTLNTRRRVPSLNLSAAFSALAESQARDALAESQARDALAESQARDALAESQARDALAESQARAHSTGLPILTRKLKTKLTIPEEWPIIALSDIHADIDALIIALRDCAKVIIKNPKIYDGTNYGLEYHEGFCHTNIRLDAGDAFLENLLNLDLNKKTNDDFFNKHCDLGYMWIGGPSHVVIVGDILDGLRTGSEFRKQCGNHDQLEHQYPQIEVKILKFLNKLDEYAEKSEGRVIKLVGNHEAMNFLNDKNDQNVETYAFANTMSEPITTKSYYENLSRSSYFNFEHNGFELFRERGTAVLLIINDIIFVHGNLNSTIRYNEIEHINNTLNGVTTIKNEYFKSLFGRASDPYTKSILWDRTSGYDEYTSKRLNEKDKRHCIMLNRYIEQFCAHGLCNKDNVKLIIGHCPQSDTQDINTTIGKIVDEDDTVTTYHADSFTDIYTGHQNIPEQKTFGIAMECSRRTQERDTPNHIVYKVDTGISRGFDTREIRDIAINTPKYREYVMHTVLSFRTPQVLKIENNLDYIIKSNSLNTRRHQPRLWFEELIHRLNIERYGPALGLPPVLLEAEVVPVIPAVVPVIPAVASDASVQGGGQYRSYVNYHKYMKYKKKYIEFKKTRKNMPK
jgi:hypothetical protein